MFFSHPDTPSSGRIPEKHSAFIDDEGVPAGTLIVTKTADTSDGVCDSDCSLREAVVTANTTPSANTILFSSLFDTPQTITLGGNLLLISHAAGDSLTITGPGANLLTVAATNSRIFEIGAGDVASISGMTMSGGNGGAGTSGSFPGFGGAIYNTGILTVSGVVITDSRANIAGGGIYTSSSDTLHVINSTISNNIADFDNAGDGDGGGGLYGTTGAIMNITGSTISGNSTGPQTDEGGGGVTGFGTTNITNSTISGNSSGVAGGGVHIGNGTATLVNVTVVGNTSSTNGGGLWVQVGDVANVGNSIIANNTALTSGPNIFGTITSQGYNLIEDTSGGTIAGTTTGNILGQDPVLGPLADNGGPTFTHRPLNASPVIDSGNSTLTVDQRGMARPVDLPSYPNAPGGNATDIGSVELLAPTAAAVSITGRVIDSSGRPIRNAVLVLEGGALLEPRFIATGSFGLYGFDGLNNGTYTVTVVSKRYTFPVPSRTFALVDDITGADFVADPQE